MRTIAALAIVMMIATMSTAMASAVFLDRTLKANRFNDLLGRQLEQDVVIKYQTSDRSTWIILGGSSMVAVKLNDTAIDCFKKGIAKYKEWNKKASNEDVKLQKRIRKYYGRYMFTAFGDKFHPSEWAYMNLHFLSQTEQKHQLVISFDELTASDNEFIGAHNLDWYLTWDQVIALEKALSDESFKQYEAKISAQDAIEDSFN